MFRTAELLTAQGSWAAGTTGVIIAAFDDGALIEIVDESDGSALALLALPYDAVRVT